jgi:HAD superfamily hydrolase (TIGR01509 family)
VDALLVDLYDTLVWTDWAAVGARLCAGLGVDGAALYRGFELTQGERSVGKHGGAVGDLRAVARACGAKVGDDRIAAVSADVLTFMKDRVHLYDDVLPELRRWRAAGTRLAVVSNCDHATRPLLDALGLEAEVDALVLSCEVGSMKPDPAIFREALDRLEADPRRSAFVDDQARYLDGAAALGLRTFRIVRDPVHGDRTPIGRHPVITSLTEVGA